jgi:hypothetical protein
MANMILFVRRSGGWKHHGASVTPFMNMLEPTQTLTSGGYLRIFTINGWVQRGASGGEADGAVASGPGPCPPDNGDVSAMSDAVELDAVKCRHVKGGAGSNVWKDKAAKQEWAAGGRRMPGEEFD